ncbi:TlpA family protein disulfide reductase [Flavobacterium silvaticum]|nr:TlpA family protein disulfide reductase [Flavobacterium silvaticum]
MNLQYSKSYGFLLLLVFLTIYANAQTPSKVYSADGISVKSYNFEGLRPILERKATDTTYVINFWATWCAPCVAELPNFEKLTTAYPDSKIKVILVSLDFTKQVEKNLLPFLKKKQSKSEVVHLSDPDANSWIDKVDPEWSGAIPATVIYNPSLNLRKFYEQSFTFEALQSELKPFITLP